MKKNMKNLCKAAMVMLMISSQAYSMQVTANGSLQTLKQKLTALRANLDAGDAKNLGSANSVTSEAPPVEPFDQTHVRFMLLNDHTSDQDVCGYYKIDGNQSVAKDTAITVRGHARGGCLLVEMHPNYPAIIFVRKERIQRYLEIEFQPKQCAYDITHQVNVYGDFVLQQVLKTWLQLSHTMKDFENIFATDAKYAQALVEAVEKTEESLNYVFELLSPKDDTKKPTITDGRVYTLYDYPNKGHLRSTHLPIAWLNTDMLKVLRNEKGAEIHWPENCGAYKNYLHFLMVFLSDGRALKAMFGDVTPELIQKIKAMIKALVYDHQIPVLPVIRATFAHPDYTKEKRGKELEMLQNFVVYIYEPLINELNGSVVKDQVSVPGLIKLIAEYTV